MTTYCAPCLADLALVREAVTAVAGTAACMAHAVLLTHPTDTPQRRLTRLGELRTLAEGKLTTASAEEAPAIELLVQEYALAGAMDMTVPLKDLAGDRTPRPPKGRRNRPGRGDRPEGEHGAERGPRPERGERGPRPERGERGPRAERATEAAGAADSAGAQVPSAPAADSATSGAPAPTGAPAENSGPAESSGPAVASAPAESAAPVSAPVTPEASAPVSEGRSEG